MKENKEVVIPLSKQKIVLLILIGAVFVGLGIWFVAFPPPGNHMLLSNPYLLGIVGAMSIVFGSLVMFFLIKKMLDTKPGMVINREGVFDNATAVSAGLIPWEDIVGIEEVRVFSETFILIMVRNPEQYIEKVANVWKRRMVASNCKHHGTPISISTNALKITRSKLLALLLEEFDRYKCTQS
ncbi:MULTISPECIES: STM3941 family protein [Myroides]|uniref:Uncharacterized protein n=1 Tax=Myroides albus TaxID=2562892 RepID=A0A6I3LPC2_9FLAO|nr:MULTISPECIES: STM3941 family protein [Myroides]MTG99170.1 hypothetical protein [Myroides albus]MVX36907.1 hypothetical protein [Myroides sp. LoEW2-1]UVD80195.1 hypothetical protein NWE55_02595 [Myroides albus]